MHHERHEVALKICGPALRSCTLLGQAPPHSLSECLLVYDIRHLCNIAPIVRLEDVDQSLHTTSCHALVRIGGEPRDASPASEVRHEAATVGNGWVAQRRICRQRCFLVNVESCARDPVLPYCPNERDFVH